MRVVGVDWSGRLTREQHNLWMAEAAVGSGTGLVPGPLAGRTRAGVAERLLALADNDADLIVGLDFGFSLPAWFLHEQGITDIEQLWSDALRLEGWLLECRPPFWGRPGRPRPPDQVGAGLRATEAAAAAIGPTPRSVFQIGGAGAVGTGSLRGMPMLSRLRAAGFSVWPFDVANPPVLLEVWPRHHYPGPLVKSRRDARAVAAANLPGPWRPAAAASEDAFDAAITAAGLAAAVAAIVAAAPPAHPLAALEGWIWGVPVPGE